MTEAGWKKRRVESKKNMLQFIKTLREANKKSSTTKIKYGNKK